MIPEEERQILEEFIVESQQMVRECVPLIQAAISDPEQEDLVARVTGSCFRLFHSVKGTGGFLRLVHLAAPAEAMEYLLDQVRSGVFSLNSRHLLLLAESCRFLEQGMVLVRREGGDDRLAGPADALTAAILQSMHPDPAITGRTGTMESPAGLAEAVTDLLATAEQEFVLWDFIAVDHQRVGELCRLLHRLKMSFAQYGCADFERICTALDATLNRYLQGEFFQTEYPERVFLRSIDAIQQTLARAALTGELKVEDLDQHLGNIRGLMRQPIGELLIEAGLVDPRAVDMALERQRTCREVQPRRLGEVLVEMGEVTSAQIQRALQKQHSKRRGNEQGQPVRVARSSSLPSLPAITAELPFSFTVDGRRFARLHALIRQLAAAQAGGPTPQIGELVALAMALNQEALASFQARIKKMVDELAAGSGKRVQLVCEGLELLVARPDLGVLSGLLAQLLRNGVEHGLETLAERLEAGKRKSGRLQLTVVVQEGELRLKVEDDGRGIDQESIVARLINQGLAIPEEVAGLSAGECLRLLLRRQGRSSAGGDTLHSECQQGLAAVNSGIHSLGGRMEMATAVGKGTRITLHLPHLA